jgi:hypothetical protein
MKPNVGADTKTVRLIDPQTKKAQIVCYYEDEEVLKLLNKGWTVHPDQYNLKYWEEGQLET